MPTQAQLEAALEESMQSMDTSQVLARILIYGKSGVGKTVEALKLAQMICPTGKSILSVDATQGWVSAKNHEGLTDNAKVMAYKGISQLDALSLALLSGSGSFANIGVVILDELSTMSSLDLDVVLNTNANNDKDKDPDVPAQRDYLANTKRMERTVARLLKMPCSLIILAHERMDKDERTKLQTTAPAFSPAFSKTLKESLHASVNMTATELKNAEQEVRYTRSLQVHPTKMVDAKTRVGFDKTIVSPEVFNNTVKAWMEHGTLVDEKEVVELVSERPVDSTEFVGIEVE